MEDIILAEDIDLRNIVKVNELGMKIFGYFCPDYPEKMGRRFYYVYSIFFVGFTYITCLLTQISDMVASYGDMEKMTNASFLTLTNLVQAVKLYIFIFRGQEVRKLLNSVNRKEFRPKNSDQCRIVRENIRVAQIISKGWLSMVCVVCSLWGIFPLLNKQPDGSIHLPLSGWFPFDINKSPAFEIVYAYQTFTSFVNGLGVICVDTFMMGLIMVIPCQLCVLCNSLKDMTENSLKETTVRQKLIENIIHYRNILGYASELTDIFTTCIMTQFVISAVISCITLFQLTLVSVSSLQFMSTFLYEGGILLEIFLWCYYGNEVILKSKDLINAAYFCKWADCSKEFKKDLLIFMTRVQMPLKLYAGGYFTLSLQTFMTIAKSSWSYCAVLIRIHSNSRP